MTAPDRIWYNGHTQHMRELRHSPPTSDTHPQVEYIRADLATPAAMTPEMEALVEAVERLLPVARHYGGLTDEHVAAIMDAEATIRNFRKVSTVKHSLTTDAALAALRAVGAE